MWHPNSMFLCHRQRRYIRTSPGTFEDMREVCRDRRAQHIHHPRSWYVNHKLQHCSRRPQYRTLGMWSESLGYWGLHRHHLHKQCVRHMLGCSGIRHCWCNGRGSCWWCCLGWFVLCRFRCYHRSHCHRRCLQYSLSFHRPTHTDC